MEARDYPRAAEKVQGSQEEARAAPAGRATVRLDSALPWHRLPGPARRVPRTRSLCLQ
jgi:hypothetical protein